MKITSAQYILNFEGTANDNIKATIDGQTMQVPLDPDNRHYAEILRQVKTGQLIIKEADD